MAGASMEELKGHFTALAAEMRPWAEFVGPVAPPKWTQPDVARRMSVNIHFFKANYALVISVLSAYYILTSPGLLLTLLVCIGLFLGVFLTRKKTILLMNGAVAVTDTMKLGAATVITIILLGATGYLFYLQWAVSMGGMVCMAHALLRPPVARALAAQRSAAEADASGGGRPADLEGGGLSDDDPRNMPANANMRLRSRPFGAGGPAGGEAGGAASPALSHTHAS